MSIIAIIAVLTHFILSKIVVEYKYTPENEVVAERNDLMENKNNNLNHINSDTKLNVHNDVETELLSHSENI